MFELTSKNKKSGVMNNACDHRSEKKSSKFHSLYDEALQEVKKKIPTQSENFPIINLKSYEIPVSPYQQHTYLSEHNPSRNIFTSREHKSLLPHNKRAISCFNKNSVNKGLWSKKTSLETLRLCSSSNKLKASNILRETHRESLKVLRQKTFEEKFLKEDEEENAEGHFSIVPLNLTSSREEKEKFLANKKKIEEKFKITFLNDKEKKLNKINFFSKIEKNPNWEIHQDENEFVDFVTNKINSNY